MLFTILNRFCSSNGSIVYCEKEQTLNSGECSELAGTLTSPTKMLEDKRLVDVPAAGIAKAERIRLRYKTENMMLFNNGHDVTIMNTTQLHSSLDHAWPASDTTTACQDNLISTDIQSYKAVKYSIHPYFSSTLEVSIYVCSYSYTCKI